MNARQWLVSFGEFLRDSLAVLVEHLPRLLGALLLVGLGWVVARLLRVLVRRLVARLEELARRRTGGEETDEQRVAARVAAGIAFWLVLLFFVAASTELLGLPVMTRALSGLAAYLPSALGAALILLAAFLFADVVKRTVESAATSSGFGYAEFLGELAKVFMFVVAGILALEQLGVDSTILVVLSATVFGGLVGGAAFAFGLGARTTVANILASHYLLQTYRETARPSKTL